MRAEHTADVLVGVPSRFRVRANSKIATRIATWIGEKRILCGNRQNTSTIGDAPTASNPPRLPHGSAERIICEVIDWALIPERYT